MAVVVELITNGGGETYASGEFAGWVELVGNWYARTSNPAPYSGSQYFACGAQSGTAEIRQDIDVTAYAYAIDAGTATVAFSGRMSSFAGDGDKAREIVEYRDAGGSVLASYDTGETDYNGSWIGHSDARTVPALTRAIHVRLLSRRVSGSNSDGYHDAISLVLTVPDPPPPEAPLVSEVYPSGEIGADDAIGFDVTDDDGLSSVAILVSFEDGPVDLAYDGVRWRGQYRLLSTTETVAGGYRYRARRSGGWTSSPTLEVVAVDVDGNFGVLSPADGAPATEGVAPVVGDFVPDPGTDVSRWTPIQFTVTDNAGVRVALVAVSIAGSADAPIVAYDGDAIRPGFTRSSSVDGTAFRIIPDIGWDVSPVLEFIVVDTSGNSPLPIAEPDA